MKRKFKVLASVFSLCLAVTLMAFGVYAASTVSFNINGTISYVNSDIYATIEMDVYQSTEGVVGYTDATVADATYSETSLVTDTAFDFTSTQTNGTFTKSYDDISFNSNSAVKFVFKVTSNQTSTFDLAATVTGTRANLVSPTAVVSSATVAKDSSATVTVYFGLDDTSVDINATDFTIAITLS